MQDKIRECQLEGENAYEPLCGEDQASDSKVDPIKYILSLAPLDSSDAQVIRIWRNDYKIWRWCRQNDFISDVEQARWFERQANDVHIKMYKIVVKIESQEKSNIVTVGVCGLTSIDYLNRRAEFSLYIAPAFQGNKFGKQALSCLLTHGFKNLGLHSIYGETFEGNPAIKMFESLGFYKEGTRRDFYFRDGGFIDAHIYSIKEGEWKRYSHLS